VFADKLAAEGYDLLLVSRSEPALRSLADRLRGERGAFADVLAADLTQPADLARVEERAAAGDLDLLVNNAGFGTSGPFAELDPAVEEEEIRLNVVALVRLTRAALPRMIERRAGAIINVSSMAGFQPGPFNATYCATKAFVNSFTEALHEEVRGTGVRVQALCPGFTRTGFQARAGVNSSAIPAAAWMSPEAVVDASLRSLARGEAMCVPGLHNLATVAVAGSLPRALVRRLAGAIGRRL
jgi:hypothetical protein